VSAMTQVYASRYIELGYAPIPVPAGVKNPNRRGWEQERHTLEDVPRWWNNGQNIGLLTGSPSGWLVDVDLDVPEAVSIAGRFLEPTRTSGHGEQLDLHWWYVAEAARTRDYLDTDGKKKLIELRANGRQTLVAPSLHPNGNEYAWNPTLELVTVEARELEQAVNKLATATLIACHLPEHRRFGGGGRHDFALALAGYMLRNNRLNRQTVLSVLRAAWDAKSWPSQQDRREAHRDLERAVEDTAQKLEQGKKAKGGRKLEEMEPRMAARIADYWEWEELQGEPTPEEKEERRNQADRLIGYALEDVQELFVDQHGAPHALIDGEPVPLTSRCYSWLRRLMWEEEGRSVSGEYLKMAAGTLSAHAEFSGVSRELHTRAAWHEGALYYELSPSKVVRVGPGGWTFEASPPVLFRRYPNLKPLPNPQAGSDPKRLWAYLNLKAERDRRLLLAYIATIPLPHIGRPILSASGPMGSGKTTAGRLVKRLLDPTAPETVRYDPRDFLQKAAHCYILMLDNLSTLPDSASDTLCRFITGEADSKRRLYTDDEDVIIELRRAPIINGINVPTDRGDVLDRSLVVELERILDAKRMTEEELWERFEAERPELLGALFGVLAKAIARKPSLQLSRRPRLADWGEYAAAVYEVMGWGAELFLSDWDEIIKVQNRSTLDGSPVAQAIIKFMEDRESFEGSSTELHKKLESIAEEIGVSIVRDKAWPKSARWLWRRIQEVVPLLVGVSIEASRERDEAGTTISLRRVPTDNASDASQDNKRVDKPYTAGNTDPDDARSNARHTSNARADASRNSAETADSGNTDNTGNRFGPSWGSDPMRHYGKGV
jgi:hypothetical protein